MSNYLKFIFILLFGLSSATSAQDTDSYFELSNDDLTVRIRKDNGAIDHFIFQGVNFFAQGSKISDWGFSVGGSQGGFFYSATTGQTNLDVNTIRISADEVQMQTSVSSGVFNVRVTRSIRLVEGINAIGINYVVENKATDAAYKVTVFESFDPDQAVVNTGSYGAFEDVAEYEGAIFAQDIDATGMSFVMGSKNEGVVMSTDRYSPPRSASVLESIFNNPQDVNGQRTDRGFNFAFQEMLYPLEIFNVELGGGAATNENPEDIIANIPADNATGEVIAILDLDIDWSPVSDVHTPLIWADLSSEEPMNINESKESTDGGSLNSLFILFLFILYFRENKIKLACRKAF